mgnify:CR=1 FL=1
MDSNRTRRTRPPMTPEEARRLPSATDWARVADMDDARLTANAESDPDNLPKQIMLSHEWYTDHYAVALEQYLTHVSK